VWSVALNQVGWLMLVAVHATTIDHWALPGTHLPALPPPLCLTSARVHAASAI
jgi:hypothetical protein